MAEKFSPELLRTKRLAIGMSITKLSQLSRVDRSLICGYEKGRHVPTRATWLKLQQGLRGKQVKRERGVKRWRAYTPPSPPLPREFSFELGHIYKIRDVITGQHHLYEISPKYGALCEFKYEGKRGIHHCFREVRGGWARTYTDAQLIGKQIKEVEG